MGIVVGHENPSVASALQLLLAQQQAQRAQQEQAAQQDDLLNQLKSALQGGGVGGPGGPAGGNGSPSADTINVGRNGSVNAGGGNNRIAGYNLYGGRIKDPFAPNAYDLQLLRGQQELDQANAITQRQMEERAMMEAGLATREYTHDLPQEILSGLQDGSLKYSPEQQREIDSREAAKDKLLNNQYWSPAQRAALAAKFDYEIRQIKLNPKTVPVNERPVTPQQQAAQNSWMEDDPVTGQQVEYQLETRAGAIRKVPTARGQAVIDDWMDQQKHSRQVELERIKAANKPDAVAAQDRKEMFAQAKASRDRVAAIERDLRKARADLEKARSTYDKEWTAAEETGPGNGANIPNPNRDESIYKQNIAELEGSLANAQHEAAMYERLATQGGEQPPADVWGGMGPPPAPSPAPQAPVEQMGADMGMPVPQAQPIQVAAAPTEPPPVPVSSREELAALPSGTKFILPDGRTGTRQ